MNLTGSVATVNFDDKTLSRPVTTLASTLSGMVAGLNVMQTSSKPNSESSTLRIRGTGTLMILHHWCWSMEWKCR